MRKVILTMLITFLAARSFASGPGTTDANFLKAGQGVRPIGMGETYIALGDGLDTLYWNPAGLVQMSSPAASVIHNFWFQDIGTEYLAYGMPMGPLGAVAGGVTYMHAGTIDKTTEDQFGNYAGVQGQASAMSLALVGAYSQKLGRLMPVKDPFFSKMMVGASLRIVSETISDVNIFGGGIDIGAIWKDTEEISPTQIATAKGINEAETGERSVRDRGFRFGVVGQNLGMTSDKLLPINFRAGAGYVIQDLFMLNGRGTIAMDALVPIDNTVKVSVGAEFANVSPNTEFAVRLGYKVGNEIQDLDSTAGLTAGAGFAIAAGLIKYQLDYAFVPYGDLGTTHRISLTLGFLPSDNVVKTQPEPKAEVVKPARRGEVLPEWVPKSAETKTAGAKAVVSGQAAAAVPMATQPLTAMAPAATDNTQNLKKLNQELQLLLKQIGANLQPAIAFENETANVQSESQKSLDKVGKILAKYPEGNVVIIGYAKKPDLALARANAVMRYLKMNFSADTARLSTKTGDPAQQPKNSAISFVVQGL